MHIKSDLNSTLMVMLKEKTIWNPCRMHICMVKINIKLIFNVKRRVQAAVGGDGHFVSPFYIFTLTK